MPGPLQLKEPTARRLAIQRNIKPRLQRHRVWRRGVIKAWEGDGAGEWDRTEGQEEDKEVGKRRPFTNIGYRYLSSQGVQSCCLPPFADLQTRPSVETNPSRSIASDMRYERSSEGKESRGLQRLSQHIARCVVPEKA